jgi:hypothetical protein
MPTAISRACRRWPRSLREVTTIAQEGRRRVDRVSTARCAVLEFNESPQLKGETKGRGSVMVPESGLGWIFGLGGAGMLLVALHLCRRPVRLLRAGGRVQGVVVGSEKTFGATGRGATRRYYRPKVRFTTKERRTLTFTSKVGHGKPLTEGSEVPVMYDLANPGEAEVASFASTWLFPMVTALFGAPFFLTGLGLLLSR